MTEETRRALEEQARDAIENGHDLDEFMNILGWADWMQEFTEADANNGEELTEAENKEINEFIEELWDDVKAAMPLKIFKVYGQNIRGHKHITEVDEDEVTKTIDDIVTYLLDSGAADITSDEDENEVDNEKLDDIYSSLAKMFELNGYLEAGDYMITKEYGEGCITIPSVVGHYTEPINF